MNAQNTEYLPVKNSPHIPVSKVITSDFLYKNIKNIQQSIICLEPIKLINKDANGLDCLNINLHKTDLRNKHINSIKLQFVSKKINNEFIIPQETIDSNLKNIKYNIMCGYNLIFYDNFYQNEDLLTPELFLPIKYIADHHSISVNIINIVNILSMLNDLELHISFTEIEFDKELDNLFPTLQIDQKIQRKNNTFNLFSVMFGMGVKSFNEDLPKIDNIILV